MKLSPSPIKLKSSIKAKLKATKSPVKNQECQNSKYLEPQNKISLHMIVKKQSPKGSQIKSNFTPSQIEMVRSKEYNNFFMKSGIVRKSVSPRPNIRFISPGINKSYIQNCQSTTRFNQTTVCTARNPIIRKNYESDLRLVNTVLGSSPPKIFYVGDQQKVQIEGNHIIVTKRPTSMMSPSKTLVKPFVLQVETKQVTSQSLNPSKQIELERKVKILETRIAQIHEQKNKVQSSLNEINIRLQYENNFLKQKINILQKNQNKEQLSRIHLKEVSESNLRNNETLGNFASERLIKQLQKIEQNQYYQSKQIQQLKNKLNEAQNMLTTEIGKNLQLLQQIESQESKNQKIKNQLKDLQQKYQQIQKQLKKQMDINQIMLKKQNQYQFNHNLIAHNSSQSNQILQRQLHNIRLKLDQSENKNKQLIKQIQFYKKQAQQILITKDLLSDLEHNNLLLIQAIKQLQNKSIQSQKKVQKLLKQKQLLQKRIQQYENTIKKSENSSLLKQKQFQIQLQHLKQKLVVIQKEFKQKQLQVQLMNRKLYQKDMQLKNKINKIILQQQKIQELMKNSINRCSPSTSSSFYKQGGKTCQKCDQLRKTVSKLNGYLKTTVNGNA